ncbi:two component transcriptional regulator, LuxR family [Ruminiclostridium papyrosolvens DSM 2782]|uniref:Stage 0 sporulation protein A homolog n=1 Tax=Ruminiclostridium papyrosolvens DSM 2782 TaxID=588581 RepID=F1T8N4_9FIRM|nr:response regulator transcription factor [Ruminiclostridium papyrosolvens]EGD48866.1 two component transcriptional regulator, LuxR family [Ruminiclostridium papyrosolvens DSM 2782]WES35352.1 response regulator transcription factor [Ruminiclostridium papyrosolvens DSM 2782]
MIKIVIADDMQMFRESLKFMIESDKEMQVIGLVSSGKEALDFCNSNTPDMIIMDLKMPELDGFEATRLIKHMYSEIKIVILSTFNDEVSVTKAVKYGADGFITKDMGLLELHHSIRSIHIGLRVFEDSVLSNIVSKIDTVSAEPEKAIDISPREISIIKLIADGKSYKEIGETLYLAEGTVRNIVYKLLSQLDLKDRIQLAVYAAKRKLI